MSKQPSDLWRAASIQGFEDNPEDSEDTDCGICLDADHDVGINGCDHRLCIDCAVSLCEIHKKPPLCPFCRRYCRQLETTLQPSIL